MVKRAAQQSRNAKEIESWELAKSCGGQPSAEAAADLFKGRQEGAEVAAELFKGRQQGAETAAECWPRLMSHTCHGPMRRPG